MSFTMRCKKTNSHHCLLAFTTHCSLCFSFFGQFKVTTYEGVGKKAFFFLLFRRKSSANKNETQRNSFLWLYLNFGSPTKRPAWHWHINITAKKDVKTQTLSICDFLKLNRRILYIINKPPDSFIWLSMVLIKIKILCVLAMVHLLHMKCDISHYAIFF